MNKLLIPIGFVAYCAIYFGAIDLVNAVLFDYSLPLLDINKVSGR